MEFLKNLFANGPLTYDQLAEAVSKAGILRPCIFWAGILTTGK